MSWPLQEDFKPGAPMVQVPMDWFNTVSKILNYLEGSGCKIQKTSTPGLDAPWRISIPSAAGVLELDGETPLPDGTAAAGTSMKAAHGDHIHPPNVDDEVIPESVGYGYAVGTDNHYAHADHAHDGAPSTPVVPANFTTLPAFWGEFSGASGGSTPPSTNAWSARGLTGHVADTGVLVLAVERVYIDNSQSAPNLCAVQRALLFSDDGRLISVSDPFTYVISPTIAV